MIDQIGSNRIAESLVGWYGVLYIAIFSWRRVMPNDNKDHLKLSSHTSQQSKPCNVLLFKAVIHNELTKTERDRVIWLYVQ